MSAASEFAGHIAAGTIENVGPMSSTEDAAAQELIGGSLSTYPWYTQLRLLKNNSAYLKVLWKYAQHLGYIGPNEEV